MSTLRELAWAKINLTLEVLGRRTDGYHELSSLVAFADFGDVVSLEPEEHYDLSVEGPFGQGISGSNVIEKVVRLIYGGEEGAPLPGPGVLHLEKNIPVAAGLGGGTADAAALLRLMTRLGKLEIEEDYIETTGRLIGADVPVSIRSKPAFMAGIGEVLMPVARLPEIETVLINPGVDMPTGPVFKALDAALIDAAVVNERRRSIDLQAKAGFASFGEVIEYMGGALNDLEAPAFQIAPEIKRVLDLLQRQERCAIARLTGSGATCFGLFEAEVDAVRAADKISELQPGWWVKHCRIRGVGV